MAYINSIDKEIIIKIIEARGTMRGWSAEN